jgi:hypothetical protein
MKQKTVFLMLMVFASFAFAQAQQPTQSAPATTKPLADTLDWLTGNWGGEGLMSGDQEFLGTMKGTRELDDEAIVLMRESMNKAGGLSGGRKEIMVIGYEGTTKKIVMTLHTSNNFIGIYTGEMKDHEIVFTLATNQPGYVDRRSFKQLPDGGVSFIIERGAPGKNISKLVEINFKKKA